MNPKLVPILERALNLPKGIVERDAEWANAKPGDPPWPPGKLAEAYLLAGMDRRALLRRVGLIEDASAVTVTVTTLEPAEADSST